MWVEQSEAQERYNTCKGCEFFNPSLTTCKKCGCFMKAKVKLSMFSCPEGKW